MHMLLSLSALLITVFLVQVGSGSMGPLDALSGLKIGFNNTEIGLIGGAHFVGFLIGCFISPALVGRVGHARAFSFMAGLSIIAVLLHPLIQTVPAWMLFRVFIGLAVAGSYTSLESWLNAKLDNSNRNKFYSIYRVVDLMGGLTAQALIASLTPASYVSYNIVAVVICLSFLPLALTQSAPPAQPASTHFRPLFAFKVSPLAVTGVLIVGATNSAIRMIAPVFAFELNLTATEISLFLVLFVLGGAFFQLPVALFTSKMPARRMLLILSILTIFVSVAFRFDQISLPYDIRPIFVLMFLFGGFTMPIYSICAVHANSLVKTEDMVSLSASLIFFFGIGAIFSPIIAGYLIDQFGPNSLFTYFVVLHVILVIYTLYRQMQRPGLSFGRSYVYVPRTTVFIAERLRRNRKKPNA